MKSEIEKAMQTCACKGEHTHMTYLLLRQVLSR